MTFWGLIGVDIQPFSFLWLTMFFFLGPETSIFGSRASFLGSGPIKKDRSHRDLWFPKLWASGMPSVSKSVHFWDLKRNIIHTILNTPSMWLNMLLFLGSETSIFGSRASFLGSGPIKKDRSHRDFWFPKFWASGSSYLTKYGNGCSN